MIAGVADTHAAVWFFSGDARLSASAKEFFYSAAATRRKIALSSISLAEVVYLVEKSRLPASAYDDLKQALANPNHVLEEATFNAEVVEAMRQVSRADVPDMPDRIVAATAVYFGVPVITRDGRIRASNLQTIW
ncbi:MAG: PIN domain-containing protein [Bryobacteraceae bacterium]